jgi:hypothetical protein
MAAVMNDDEVAGRQQGQDKQVANNMRQSGGKQRKSIWRWMTRQEEGGGGHNTGLLGCGQYIERGDSNFVASVTMHLEWKTMRRIKKGVEKDIGNDGLHSWMILKCSVDYATITLQLCKQKMLYVLLP